MPQLGLGLGLHKSSRIETPLQALIKSSNLYLSADKADGLPFPKLQPRTLPNGVSNGEYTPQNVSGDVVIQSGWIITFVEATTNNYASMNISNLTNIVAQSDALVDGSVVIELFPSEVGATIVNTPPYSFRTTSVSIFFSLPKTITNLSEARSLIGGKKIRYQLATPIDTLNVPFKNPWTDLKGDADCTLVNFAGTTADGWTTDTAPNGKSVVGLKGDGLDSYGLFGSNAPNPVGLQDFAFAFVFKTPTTWSGFLYCRAIGEAGQSNEQFSVYPAGGLLYLRINGTLIITNFAYSANTFYKLLIKRVSGTLTVKLNELNYSVANNSNIVSRPLTRLFTKPTNSEGTTHTSFSNQTLFEFGYNNGQDIDKFEANFNKVCASKYGL